MTKEKYAFISFVFGISSLTAYILFLRYSGVYGLYPADAILYLTPYLSLPFGLIFGILGLKSKRVLLAKAGLILCISVFILNFILTPL